MSFRTAYGYTHSENGWRMCNRDECVVALTDRIPHTRTAPVRRGHAATILNAWLLWYHANVEPITTPVWGWSAENDVPNSNHLSGTALDIHAPKYPWGARAMPADLIAKVEKGLALFEGTIFWGARWSKPDQMHYQLGYREGDPRIAAFAARLSVGHLGIYGSPEDEPADEPAPAPDISGVFASKVPGSSYRGELSDFVLEIDARTHADHTQTLPAILDHLSDINGKLDRLLGGTP